jgi:hypothetical protein
MYPVLTARGVSSRSTYISNISMPCLSRQWTVCNSGWRGPLAQGSAEGAIPCRGYGFIMNERKLLKRLARGDVANVAFGDLCALAEALSFELRVSAAVITSSRTRISRS